MARRRGGSWRRRQRRSGRRCRCQRRTAAANLLGILHSLGSGQRGRCRRRSGGSRPPRRPSWCRLPTLRHRRHRHRLDDQVGRQRTLGGRQRRGGHAIASTAVERLGRLGVGGDGRANATNELPDVAQASVQQLEVDKKKQKREGNNKTCRPHTASEKRQARGQKLSYRRMQHRAASRACTPGGHQSQETAAGAGDRAPPHPTLRHYHHPLRNTARSTKGKQQTKVEATQHTLPPNG